VIICIAIHQKRSTVEDRDGFHHQLQTLLRNAPSSIGFLWQLSKLHRAWGQKISCWKRTLLLGIPALGHSVLMLAASIFSSSVLLSGDDVLLRGSVCGFTDSTGDQSLGLNQTALEDLQIAQYAVGTRQAAEALQYARDCYSILTSSNSTACDRYTVPSININTDHSVKCPFGENICAQESAFSVDSGYVDTSTHLGINSDPGDRIHFLKKLTCAPTLAEEKYSSDWTPPGNRSGYSVVLPGDMFKLYDLGYSLYSGTTFENVTFTISNYSLWENWPGYNLV
jgi:hypothetical protein